MKDLGWKLLSVAIATTMWFMVISINQPIDTRSYSTTLQLVGEETLTARGLTVANREDLTNTKISIKVKAQSAAGGLDFCQCGSVRFDLCSGWRYHHIAC